MALESGVSTSRNESSTTPSDFSIKEKSEEGDEYGDLLKVYEEMFQQRYTDEDNYYMESIKKPISDPPIVHPWYNKPRRNFDHVRGGRSGGNDSWRDRRHHNWSENQREGRNYNNRNQFKDHHRRPYNRHAPY